MRPTKLITTTIALALMLVLSMSAFAAPTTLLFSDHADVMVDGVPSISAYKANRNAYGFSNLAGWNNPLSVYQGSTVTGGFAKIYYGLDDADSFTLENGVPVLNLTKTGISGNPGLQRIIYGFNTPLTYQDAIDNDKAIVTSFDFKMLDQPSNWPEFVGFHVRNRDTNAEQVYTMGVGWLAGSGNNFTATSAGNSGTVASLPLNQTHNYTVAVAPITAYGAEDTSGGGRFWWHTRVNYDSAASRVTNLVNTLQYDGFQFVNWKKANLSLSNVLFYEVSTKEADIYFKNTTNTDVAYEDDLEIIVSQPVLKDVENALIVKRDGTTLVKGTDYTVTVGQKINGTEVNGVITLSFVNGLGYGKTYTVETGIGYLTNMLNVTNNVAQMATFTTEATPTYSLSLEASKGFTAGGTTVTDLSTSADQTVYFKATAAYGAGRNRTGVIIIGIYDNATDNLVKCVTTSHNFTANTSETLEATFKIGANQYAKAWVNGVLDPSKVAYIPAS